MKVLLAVSPEASLWSRTRKDRASRAAPPHPRSEETALRWIKWKEALSSLFSYLEIIHQKVSTFVCSCVLPFDCDIHLRTFYLLPRFDKLNKLFTIMQIFRPNDSHDFLRYSSNYKLIRNFDRILYYLLAYIYLFYFQFKHKYPSNTEKFWY